MTTGHLVDLPTQVDSGGELANTGEDFQFDREVDLRCLVTLGVTLGLTFLAQRGTGRSDTWCRLSTKTVRTMESVVMAMVHVR